MTTLENTKEVKILTDKEVYLFVNELNQGENDVDYEDFDFMEIE